MDISDEALSDLAGPGAFERGCDYYQNGHVFELDIVGNRVKARVSGTHQYHVELWRDGSDLGGGCDCPASENIVFCKHCVATALALRDHLVESVLGGSKGDSDALSAYLEGQSSETLASYLLQVLPKDPVLHAQLSEKAGIAATPVDPKALRQALTEATRPRAIFESRESRAYFRHLEATLQHLLNSADGLSAEDLLDLTIYGMHRLNKALEQIDDSDGFRADAQAMLGDLHGQSLQRLDWSDYRRAEHLLNLAIEDPWDQFMGAPLDYADTLGDAGLDAFYAVAERRLGELPELPDNASFEDKTPYQRLTRYLMERAAQREDWDEMIRLEKLTATTDIDFERIARLYLKKGDPEAAENCLSKADALDDRSRGSRHLLWAVVHAELGNWEQAVSAREAAFRQDVSYANYQDLMEFADQAGYAKVVRGSVLTFLSAVNQPPAWSDEGRAFTLMEILRCEQDWPIIREIALSRIRDPNRLITVARWMVRPTPADAKPIYEKAIESLIDKKTRDSYRAAVKALHESRPAFEAAGANAHDECIRRLREKHYRKRNFMAELDAVV
jgi:uncharacterized Zn finger protein